jgi:hypothetical protein
MLDGGCGKGGGSLRKKRIGLDGPEKWLMQTNGMRKIKNTKIKL